MKHPHIIAGIDIGSADIKVVIATLGEMSERGFPRVLGQGYGTCKGLRHGYVVSVREVADSVQVAIGEAERKAGVRLSKAFVALGGVGLGSVTHTSSVIITRADSEITELDTERALSQCEKDLPSALIVNKKILHSVPLEWRIDGKAVLGRPEGMKGNKLEVKMLFATCLTHHVNDVLEAVEMAGIEIEDVMAAPLAASLVTLSKTQKIAGCILTNIGAETTSVAVFENNVPSSIEVFPVGSNDITNDIALGLKVSLEEAEQIKIGAITGTTFSRKKLDEIISARIEDIFDRIDNHLAKLSRSGLLPAGIVLTGGGASLNSIENSARNSLKLPARIGYIQSKDNFKDTSWAVAYGLCVFGTASDRGAPLDNTAVFFKKVRQKLSTWFKQFLP